MTFKQSRIRNRRVNKLRGAIRYRLLRESDPVKSTEIEHDLKLFHERFGDYDSSIGDNNSCEYGLATLDMFEEMEVKYTKAPKIALKNL